MAEIHYSFNMAYNNAEKRIWKIIEIQENNRFTKKAE